jgi:methylated-DNA-[protein]-cysteine S-methyltransferase
MQEDFECRKNTNKTEHRIEYMLPRSIAMRMSDMLDEAATGTVVCTRLGWVGLVATARGIAATTRPMPSQADAERALKNAAAAQQLSIEGLVAMDALPEGVLRRAAKQLRDYYAGQPVEFDVPVDLTRQPPFRRRVLELLCQVVPRGRVISYSELAYRVGSPRAARAVGQAMRHNPLAPIVPCHRVVGIAGSLTGYGWGLQMKQLLLEIEGVLPRTIVLPE